MTLREVHSIVLAFLVYVAKDAFNIGDVADFSFSGKFLRIGKLPLGQRGNILQTRILPGEINIKEIRGHSHLCLGKRFALLASASVIVLD